MALYWCENLLVGAFTLLRLLAAGAAEGLGGFVMSLGVGAFFLLHYGAFCAAHGLFLSVMFFDPSYQAVDSGAVFLQPITALSKDGALWSVAALAGLQLVFFVDWLRRGGARRADPRKVIGAPYARLILLHLVIIIGGAIIVGLGQPVGALALLVVLKTAYDLATDRTRQGEPKLSD